MEMTYRFYVFPYHKEWVFRPMCFPLKVSVLIVKLWTEDVKLWRIKFGRRREKMEGKKERKVSCTMILDNILYKTVK